MSGTTTPLLAAPSLQASAGTTPAVQRGLVEVMIPTFNESHHIAQAVANARALGPVYVLDSLSTDGTQELARAAGATVIEHPFENYSAQKNWGLDNLPFKGEWVFILDADERITPALREEILATVRMNPRTDAYFINRLLIFMGQPVRHGGLYPSWNLRLFRRGKARYEERSVHEHVVCDGTTAYLHEEMLHIRRETVTQYIEKHIRYADMESSEWLKMRMGESRAGAPRRLFRHVLRYRQWLRRNIWPRLPWRPLWRLVYMYFFRLGFLDGRAGWHLARLMACYEYMIGLLYQEKLAAAQKRAAQALAARNQIGRANSTPGGETSAGTAASRSVSTQPIFQRCDTVAAAPYALREYLWRGAWLIVQETLFRFSPWRAGRWRAMLLRAFGAKIGSHVYIRRRARVIHPWLLTVGDWTTLADDVNVYNLGPIEIGQHTVISQGTVLCAGTHDYTLPDLPLQRPPIRVGSGVWIASEAFIGPGVTVGDNSVIGARAVVAKDVPPAVVAAGNPCKVLKPRLMRKAPCETPEPSTIAEELRQAESSS